MHGSLLAVPEELVVLERVWKSVSVFTLSMLSNWLLIRNPEMNFIVLEIVFQL